MYKAKDNQGLYFELTLLIDYIEDYEDLNLLNELLIDFKKQGLTQHDLKLAVELIEEYLPNYIECTQKGCYLYNLIDDIDTYTCFSDLEIESYFTNINKQLILV